MWIETKRFPYPKGWREVNKTRRMPHKKAGGPPKGPKKSGKDERTTSGVAELVTWALHGKMDCVLTETSNIVRIFTSSTFTGGAGFKIPINDDAMAWRYFPRLMKLSKSKMVTNHCRCTYLQVQNYCCYVFNYFEASNIATNIPKLSVSNA